MRPVTVLLAGLLLAAPARAADSGGRRVTLHGHHAACVACTPDSSAPAVPLSEAGVDSIGRAMSFRNARAFLRTDSLYRAGVFGDPGTDDARKKALIHFQLRSETGFDYTADLGTKARLYQVDERSFEVPFGHEYMNSTVYPLKFLERGLAGYGRFCMQYQMPASFDEMCWIGGIQCRMRDESIEVAGGQVIPALIVSVEMEDVSSVDMIYESTYCGRITEGRIVDRGDTLDFCTISDLDGMYVRKFGLHKLGALIAWRSHVEGDRDPEHPRIGSCAYFPHIKLVLPGFLPSISLDNLRDFDVPQPVLPVEWFQQQGKQDWDWIKVDVPDGLFVSWKAWGKRPGVVEERFPNR